MVTQAARAHPITLLYALRVYSKGAGDMGSHGSAPPGPPFAPYMLASATPSSTSHFLLAPNGMLPVAAMTWAGAVQSRSHINDVAFHRPEVMFTAPRNDRPCAVGRSGRRSPG